MPESRLDAVRVVLYEPQDHVNIAATVRAMKNMGVNQLRLVRPVEYDAYRLEGIAHGTNDVIEAIQTFPDIEDAVADSVKVFAFTARRRAAKFRILDPKQAARELIDASVDGPVSILFGREDTGLPNDAIERAHAVVSIPTTEHSSINLAQAVLIALYELHLAAGDATRVLPPARKETGPPTAAELELFFEDAERALKRIEFFKTRYAEHIMRSLRAMVTRANPDARELMLLRAIFIEVVRYIERTFPRT
ncbi:MAG TPA: RNA methyltransferase [Gemmatimonadaceae bacterium]|jgi:TrmH family RNA methyltransferase